MEDKAKCNHPLYWHNCYKGSQDLYHSDAFQHPAKMAIPLAFRIMEHLKELGLLKEEDTILDPMSGISTTGIVASALGHKFIGVELEDKFIELSKKNKEYAERKLYKGFDWQLIKGDSRRLSDLLKGQGLKSVVSPPYESSLNNTAEQKGWDKLANDPTSSRYGRKSIPSVGAEYSDNPDNIGNLKDAPLKSINSPPYDGEGSTHNRDRQQDIERMIKKGMKVNPDSSSDTKVIEFDYGKTEGQIGNLKDIPLKSITSPPYQDSQGHPSLGSVNKDDWGKEGKDIVKRRGLSGEYGDTEGQVGNLKSITSPPYEESLPNGLDRKAAEQMVQAMYDKHGRAYSKEDFEYQVELILKRSNREYGDAEGQIGKLKDKPLKSIVSPPYSEAQSGGGIAKKGYTGSKHTPTDLVGNRSYMPEVHGQSEGQIANLKDTPLKAITSPPYGIDKTSGGLNTKPPRDEKDQAGRSPHSPSQAGAKEGYGETEGQIGILKDTPLKSIVSPPYGETGVGDWKTGRAEFQAWVINEIKTKGYVEWQGKRYNEAEWRAMNHGRIDGRTTKGVHKHPTDGYSDNPDNIGGLPDKPLKAITSPPYEQSITGGKSGIEWQEEWGKPSESRQPSQDISYGESKENIGNLKDKPLKSITSPPYGNDAKGLSQEEYEKKQAIINDKRRDRGDIKGGIGRSGALGISALNPEGYGTTEGQIGELPDKPLKSIVSPPYGDAEKRDRSKEASNEKEQDYPRGDHNISAGYQGSDENIGKLADKPLKSVMSPPYESQGFKCDENPANLQGREDKRREKYPMRPKVVPGHYGDTYDNVGNTQGESYLEAMSKVYKEISLVSDVLCVVVKCPTRAGKLRRLDLDTIAILEASNWKVHCQHRALLFEELEQAVMIDEVYTMELDLTKAVEQPTFGYKVFITPVIDDEFGILKFDELKQKYPNLKPNTVYYAPEVVGGTKVTIDGKRVAGRLSFFKRLSWQNGNPVASWEDILICVRK